MSDCERIWIGFRGGYDEGMFCGAFADGEVARTWLEKKHRESVADGEDMEEFVDEQEEERGRRSREKGWWLPTDIRKRKNGEGWVFDEKQGGMGHGFVEVYPVSVQHHVERLPA